MADLSDFNFTIKYRPGRSTADVDTLSRIPLQMEDYIDECSDEVRLCAIKAMIASVQFQAQDS